MTTSVGRLFDGVAAILGIVQRTTFEGQAAVALEKLALDAGPVEPYPIDIREQADLPFKIGWESLIRNLVKDIEAGMPKPKIAAAFHETMAEAVLLAAKQIGEKRVLLTGGCFQNAILLERSIAKLSASGFQPFWHSRVPPNDGGIALGQLVAGLKSVPVY